MSETKSQVAINALERADGSVSYTAHGYSIICSVNGPIEVQRRDELPEEAALEINIRPPAGVAGVRERYLESIVHSTLKHIILTSAHPRSLIQITLQVVSSQDDGSHVGGLPQASSTIDLLPSLLQAATLALLSASLPLNTILCAVLVAVNDGGSVVPNPTAKLLAAAQSVHALAFSSTGDTILIESEGAFTMDDWDRVHQTAKTVCLGEADGNGAESDVNMDVDGMDTCLLKQLKEIVQRKVKAENRWKGENG